MVAVAVAGITFDACANVERGESNQLGELFAAAFGRAQPELAHEVGIDIRSLRDSALFKGAQRFHLIVEMLHQDVPILVLHRRQQPSQQQRGIRSPVPIVATMQFAAPAINGYVDACRATRAEGDQLPACLMERTIAHQP
jgi:hypothetical protein